MGGGGGRTNEQIKNVTREQDEGPKYREPATEPQKLGRTDHRTVSRDRGSVEDDPGTHGQFEEQKKSGNDCTGEGDGERESQRRQGKKLGRLPHGGNKITDPWLHTSPRGKIKEKYQ